jgi:hypothetical protein
VEVAGKLKEAQIGADAERRDTNGCRSVAKPLPLECNCHSPIHLAEQDRFHLSLSGGICL